MINVIMKIMKNNIKTLQPLIRLLEKNKIPFIKRIHPAYNKEAISNITGKYQIIVNDELSIIRGMGTFGNYEMMRIKGKGNYDNDPIRTSAAKQMLSLIKKEL